LGLNAILGIEWEGGISATLASSHHPAQSQKPRSS